MIASLRRPRFVVIAALTGWVLAVGIALTTANIVPVTHAGSQSVGLPHAFAAAGILIEPQTINTRSSGTGGRLNVFITLPSGHDGTEIVPASVELCNQLQCAPSNGSWNVEGNGTFQAKFDRDAVRGILQGANGPVTLTADGQLNLPPGRFQGSYAITVKS